MLKALKLIGAFLAIFAISSLVSCEDDSDFVPVVINSVSPDELFVGEEIILQGENFNSVLFVFVDNDQFPFQLDGNTITFIAPTTGGAGERTLTLVMADGYIVTEEINLNVRPIPIIQGLSTNAAQEGEQVILRGISLDNLQNVKIGDIDANVVSSTATELVITVPSGLTVNEASNITVVTDGGESVAPGKFWISDNLLLNGGLEVGDGDEFVNWSKFNGADLMTATTEAEEAFFGRSLRAVGFGGDAWRTQLASDATALEVDADYTLSMLIKAQQGTPGNGGNIRFSTTPDALYSANYEITTEWQQIEWTFTANTTPASVVLDLGVTENAVYFIDNITLVPTLD